MGHRNAMQRVEFQFAIQCRCLKLLELCRGIKCNYNGMCLKSKIFKLMDELRWKLEGLISPPGERNTNDVSSKEKEVMVVHETDT